MSLRRKDDWDEAMEESCNRAIARGEITPSAPFVPGHDYDYGQKYTFTLACLERTGNEPSP